MKKYLKAKCSVCGGKKFVLEDNIPEKFSVQTRENELDMDSYVCKKCQKEIESKRMNHCKYCNKDFKPSVEYDYTDICQKCYNFIMNKYEPIGLIKKIFETIPYDDGHLEWNDIAEIRYKIYKLLKDKNL